MTTRLIPTRRGKALVQIAEFVAGMSLYGGIIFGAAVLEKIVQ